MFLFLRHSASPYLREPAVDRSGYLAPEIRHLGIDYNVWTAEVNCLFAMSAGDAGRNPTINCGFTMEQRSLRLPKQVRCFCGGLGGVLVIESSFCSSGVNKIKVRIIGGKQVWQGIWHIWFWGRSSLRAA